MSMTLPRVVQALLFFIIAACGLASDVFAAEPGVVLTFQSLDGKQSDTRIARLIAICVPRDTSPTPFFTPAPFRATWSGFINLKLRGEYVFSAAGTGDVEVIVNGESALKASSDDLSTQPGKPQRLKKGANAIVVKYVSPGK